MSNPMTYLVDANEKILGSSRFAKLCWIGKHINIIMKPMNSPT